MKKNILGVFVLSLAMSVSLLGTETPEFEPSTVIPTKYGLGLWTSLKDVIWNSEDNILYDLQNGTYDPNNSSYVRRLNSGIECFSRNRNDKSLLKIFDICKNDKRYCNRVQIDDIAANISYKFLTERNKDKQSELKNYIEIENKRCIEQQSALLVALQKEFTERLNAMRLILQKYLIDRDAIIAQICSEIKKIEIGLLRIHDFNKNFLHPKNGYYLDKNLDVATPESLYSAEYILKKITVDFSMNQTEEKAKRLLMSLNEIDVSLQRILTLRY